MKINFIASSMLLVVFIAGSFHFKLAFAESANATLNIDGQTYNVLSWEFSAISSSSVHAGSGSGSGATSFGNLLIEATSGQLSVKMLDLVASGVHLPDAVLVDGNLTLEMDDLIVTSASISKPLRHRFELQFVSYTYYTPSMTTCWNIQTNSPGSC